MSRRTFVWTLTGLLAVAVPGGSRVWRPRTGLTPRASYAASSVLAKQIEAGAPADLFFSADREWMDYLARRGLIRNASRRDLLGNALVLIVPVDSPLRLKIVPGLDLAGALGHGRLATGDPDSVPVGQYARQALTQLGVWQQVFAGAYRAGLYRGSSVRGVRRRRCRPADLRAPRLRAAHGVREPAHPLSLWPEVKR
jgi:molybdenum ABC transporter molybdate-binding protein